MFETNQTVKLYYTSYKSWSGRSFYGNKSGVSAVSSNTEVIVGRTTDKAVQFLTPTQEVWIPKSVLKELSPNTLKELSPNTWEVKRSFCYTNGGLSWKMRKPLQEERDSKLNKILN